MPPRKEYKITVPKWVLDAVPKDGKFHAVTYSSVTGWCVDDKRIIRREDVEC